MTLEERIAAIEARHRAYKLHDADCPAWVDIQPGSQLFAFAFRGPCSCWLTQDPPEPSTPEVALHVAVSPTTTLADLEAALTKALHDLQRRDGRR